MMVSTATAVFPVWRSPMISSRWPRPIGTMESIAFSPVCTGCETDFLQTTPGATFSMTSVILARIGPLPSIGCPSEFTTRPRSSGPTGTSRMRLVHLTVSPSVMCSYSPRITAPTESRSRFKARPKVFFGNSSISPCITSERPWTRQMPSVTVTTVPWVRTSADSERFCILLRIRSLISDGFSCCIVAPGRFSVPSSFEEGWREAPGWSRRVPPPPACGGPLLLKGGGDKMDLLQLLHSSGFQRRGHLFELAAHRAVDHFITGRDAHAADQLLVHGDVRLDPALQAPRDVRDEAVDLRVVQRKGGADLGLDHAFEPVLQLAELLVDLRQERETVVGDQHAHEVPRVDGKILLAQLHEQVVELLGPEIGVRDARAHVRMRSDPRHDRKHVQPVRESARALGEAEDGLGVGSGDGGGFSHGSQISFFSRPSSSAWVSGLTSRRRIFSAPATASAATCSLSISLARAICWSMSALAAARMRSASALAAAFASSSICASRLSAEPMISPTRSRALASSSCARLPAASSSRRPCSPAARPSAICFWRSSILPISHGQMNLTVSQMKSAKTRACAIKVRLMFM